MRAFETTTAAELRAAIAFLEDDDLVAFASDYGDRGHTEQLHRIAGDVDEVGYRESGYSVSGFAVADRDDEDDDDRPRVFVIR